MKTVKELIEDLKRWMERRFGKPVAKPKKERVVEILDEEWQEPPRHAALPAKRLGKAHDWLVSVDRDLVAAAKEHIAFAETEFPKASGENKRHRVYARLLRQFPSHSKSDVAMSIELAVRIK